MAVAAVLIIGSSAVAARVSVGVGGGGDWYVGGGDDADAVYVSVLYDF